MNSNAVFALVLVFAGACVVHGAGVDDLFFQLSCFDPEEKYLHKHDQLIKLNCLKNATGINFDEAALITNPIKMLTKKEKDASVMCILNELGILDSDGRLDVNKLEVMVVARANSKKDELLNAVEKCQEKQPYLTLDEFYCYTENVQKICKL